MQAAALPDGLAAMPPGPGLAAALGAIELARVANDRMLEVLRAQYRQLCHEQARTVAVLVEVGRCEGYPQPGEVSRLDTPEEYAAEEIRAALAWTRRSAQAEHDLAETVVFGMPAVFGAWLAGEIDRPRVLVFDRYLTGLTAEQVAAVCRAAVPRAPRLTTGQLAVLLRRMVTAVDPEAALRWYRTGIRERNVTAYLAPDGTVTLTANGLPADEAEAACVRLQDLAGAAKRAGHPGLIGQIRCDLFLGLLDGRFHHMTAEGIIAALIADYRPAGPAGPASRAGSGVPADYNEPAASEWPAGSTDPCGCTDPAGSIDPVGSTDSTGSSDVVQSAGPSDRSSRPPPAPDTTRDGTPPPVDERVGIEIRVGLPTLLGRDEHPGEVPGLGLLPAPDARARVAQQRRAEWRFAVTDSDGRLLSEGATRRRPEAVGGRGVRRDGPPGGIVELHLPVALLHELVAAGPGLCGGWAAVIADIAAQHARRDAHLADLDSRPADRLPGAALRRHTEIRDRTCTFPGCRRRAHGSDQDHTRDHAAGGPTVRANLGPLCDHDHDVKHRGGWMLDQPGLGTFVWRSPLGGTYETRGEFLLPPMPDPAPADLGPDVDHVGPTLDGPILQPRRPDPPRPPPPARDLPDEPPF